MPGSGWRFVRVYEAHEWCHSAGGDGAVEILARPLGRAMRANPSGAHRTGRPCRAV